ncbi:MAG: preprotein translocase subunit SecA [Granulosicoccus sp.]
MTLIADNIPRPGLALGHYPERRHRRLAALDEIVGRWVTRLTSRWDFRDDSRTRLIANIEREGSMLVAFSDEQLLTEVTELRSLLVYKGWDDCLAMRAFAIVREMSGRVLGMRHYDAQILGGWVIYQGKLAEMQTGEGKTLTATLPACTSAFSGVPVHIITTNDYLARRDATNMRPLYEALGLSVGIVSDEMDFYERQIAYACDITYCTNKQVCFDYLRDRVARGASTSALHQSIERLVDNTERQRKLMLRGLCFAIVDEADSVLIDEARTPLVLSQKADTSEYSQTVCKEALELAEKLVEGVHFRFSEVNRRVAFTPGGHTHLAQLASRSGSASHSGRQLEELIQQALSALHLFVRDRDYVVCDGKVQIVDSNTGRAMNDRSWGKGLQQMIETKEECTLSGNLETLARISYQRFFRRYLKLAGMTGTACEVASELCEVYGICVKPISPHRTSRRGVAAESIFVRADQSRAALLDSVLRHSAIGRPVLIGTRSVINSEQIAQLLRAEGLEVQVLNAKQDSDEAEIIAQAGEAGRITVATNMAGRGTDILLGPDVERKGGLHVIVSERNDSARVDRQLIGRCARQGEQGSAEHFASLEDELCRLSYPPTLLNCISLFARSEKGQIPSWIGTRVLNIAQKRLEARHRFMRRQTVREDERLDGVLSFSGESE